MLNKDGIRELAYLVRVDEILPMNADRLECAHIGGWNCVVGKDEFKAGDIGVYFEIDSKLPEVAPFNEMEFLKSKHYKIKTQKIRGVYSQGLLMPVSAFGWETSSIVSLNGDWHSAPTGVKINNEWHKVDDESRFLTACLGVTYAVAEDNVRKSGKLGKSGKFLSAMAHHPRFAKSKVGRWLAKREWGRKLIAFLLYSKKKQTGTDFPSHFPYITVSDEERIENCPYMLQYKEPLIATEKLDGTSTLFVLERKKRGKFEFYVVSRHVRQLKPDQECYHESNIYWEMALKYDVENHLKQYLLDNPELEYVGLQGESVGNVQGNPLKLSENEFYGYNFIRSDVGRISSLKGKEILEGWRMKWVPILDTNWINPDTMEEMKAAATAKSVVNPSVLREGVVYRSEKDNTISFKNVSPEYLLKHGQ